MFQPVEFANEVQVKVTCYSKMLPNGIRSQMKKTDATYTLCEDLYLDHYSDTEYAQKRREDYEKNCRPYTQIYTFNLLNLRNSRIFLDIQNPVNIFNIVNKITNELIFIF